MRPADTWKDYELLDATDGNRLERWGETILIRPDPQVVWKTPQQSPLWVKADAVYHRSDQGGGEWEYRRRLPEKWKISCGEGEDKLTLIVSPTGFKHTGVFPEQAVNWAWYQQKIRAANRPVKVLNLFGYTGGATLACRDQEDQPMANDTTPPPQDAAQPQQEPLAAIYHKLKAGTGHELVNDGNVKELIAIAHGYGDDLVETLLREWEAPCGVVGTAPARTHPG